MALREDGTVVAWGANANGNGQATVPPGLGSVKAVAAGAAHSLALREDGTVVAWGENGNGQAAVPPGLVNVKAVAAGGYHNLALKEDGTVVAWGRNDHGQATVPPGLVNVKAVAAGGDHSLALREDGTVVAWGYNGSGQATVPSGLRSAIAIAAGASHSLAISQDTVAPTVKRVTPTTKTGVSRTNPGITATFSEGMDEGTVEAINPTTLKPLNVKLINTATLRQVAATVRCGPDPCRKATITPKKALAANTKYRAVVTPGVKDLAGNALDQRPDVAGAQPKTWTFTTGGT